MSGFLVDTDWAIQVLHGDQGAMWTLIDLATSGLWISSISCGELYEGAYYAREPRAALASLTPEIAERFAILRGQLPRHHRQQIGDMDLLIAATAVTHDLELFTYNYKDFALIPGLSIYVPESPA